MAALAPVLERRPTTSAEKTHKGVIAEVCPNCESVTSEVETVFYDNVVKQRLAEEPENFFLSNSKTRGEHYRYCVYNRKCRSC